MGTNNLTAIGAAVTEATGDLFDQYLTALGGDLVPRNSGGNVTDEGGDLGTGTYRFQNLNFSGSMNGYGIQEVQWQRGHIQGVKVSYKDTSSFYVEPGTIDLDGDMYEVTSRITKSFSTSTADEVYGVFIDKSIISGSEITEASVQVRTVDDGDPTWSDTKQGWYETAAGSTSDRCIGFIITDTNANFRKFEVWDDFCQMNVPASQEYEWEFGHTRSALHSHVIEICPPQASMAEVSISTYFSSTNSLVANFWTDDSDSNRYKLFRQAYTGSGGGHFRVPLYISTGTGEHRGAFNLIFDGLTDATSITGSFLGFYWDPSSGKQT